MTPPRFGLLKARKFRLVIHGYFDDAKTFGKASNVMLAGYLTDDPGWDSFSNEWVLLLRKHGLERLHTSDFLSGKAPEYKAFWPLTDEERVAIVNEFIGPIRKHILCGLVCSIDSAAWRDVLKEKKKKPSPDEFCFIRLMRLAMEQMSAWGDAFPLTLVFDDSEHSMKFYSIYRNRKRADPIFRKGVSGIAFADDGHVPALQAADLLACATSKVSHRVPGTWMDDSPFFNIMLSTDPAYGKLYRAEHWDRRLIEKHLPGFMGDSWQGGE
jgi:hypothetical protein